MDAKTSRLEEALVRCLEVQESGSHDDFEAILSEYPDLRGELQSRLEFLSGMGFGVPEGSGDALPERLGDFERLERIGGGGMGVVYRARQLSLDREVALKVIRPEAASSERARERFSREVGALAKLRHPGIVQILAVGDEAGTPYFAMPLLQGATLAEVLRSVGERRPEALTGEELYHAVASHCGHGLENSEKDKSTGSGTTTGSKSSWIRNCLKVVLSAAEALSHAHDAGVLHRDVKPSNLMYCVDRRVLLFDFGLTRDAVDERMTRTGGPVGSPAYMAPEQIREEELDARTDVYALGVTLYEMLTLRLPFLAKNQEDLRRAILSGNSVKLRERNRSVPWDVETVCMVAMDRDPARRYQSMSEFAADISRLLDRESISARRPGLLLRSKRWAQRHSTIAASLILGSLLFVGTPSALYWQQLSSNERLRGAKETAERLRGLAEKREREAQDNLGLALAAVDRFLLRLGNKDLMLEPRAEKLSRQIIKDAVELFETYLKRTKGDARLLVERGRAWTSLAIVQSIQGDYQTAEASVRTAIKSLEVQAKTDDSALRALAVAQHTLGQITRNQDRSEAARGAFAKAREAYERLQALHERDSEIALDTVVVIGQLASVAQDTGELKHAAKLLEESQDKLKSIASLVKDTRRYESILADVETRQAKLFYLTSKLDPAVEHGAKAQALLEKLIGEDPDDPNLSYVLATIHAMNGRIAANHGRLPDACTELATAVHTLENLHRQFPRHRKYAEWLASESNWLAIFYSAAGKREEAERTFKSAGEHFDELDLGRLDNQKTGAARMRYGRSHARFLARMGKNEEALEILEATVEAAKLASKGLTKLPRFRSELARIFNDLGIHRVRQNRLDDGMAAYQKALEIKRDLLASAPNRVDLVASLASTQHNLATIYLRRKKFREAAINLDEAIRLKEKILAMQERNSSSMISLSRSLSNRGNMEVERRKAAAALPYYKRSIALARKSLAIVPRNRSYRSQLSEALEGYSQALLIAGKRKEAIAQAEALLTSNPKSGNVTLRAAVLLARSAGEPTRGVTVLEGQEATAARALELLERIAPSLESSKTLLDIPHLAPLESLPRFQKLLRSIDGH